MKSTDRPPFFTQRVPSGEEIERQNREREDELRRVPLQDIDKSKWPEDVRPISIKESGGLGIDKTGRLYWNGKPVEIIGHRLDLTRPQFFVAVVVAAATVIAAAATAVQAWTAYHDWACKVHWPIAVACPAKQSGPEPSIGE